ncbi:MAG: aminoacyl-tRNA hydrolase [candidate division Zixibacteria bacterium]|nr:aminoacyl-tRNA hydrolase [candidate division Zixibacteria bacterium]
MVDEAPLVKIEAVLGLGNPGRRYAENRHNLGYMVLDRLAFLKKEEFIRGDGPFVYCRAVVGDRSLYLCKPTTYMNNSGKAAICLGKYFGIGPENMLVVSDDCNLPLGKIRYRSSGSDGGHNGLASIIRILHSREFRRLRLGVNLNPPGVPLEDYVLEDFDRDEFESIDQVITAAIGFIEDLAANATNKKSATFTVTANN